MNKRKIYFYGIIPKPGQMLGGGAVGCMRTLSFMGKGGYDVTVIKRRVGSVTSNRLQRRLTAPVRFLIPIVQLFFTLLFGNRQAVVHLACFYGSALPGELILMRIAKRLGYKVVCELRAGGAQFFYDNGSDLYKRRFAELVSSADYIFSQGKENFPLLAKFTNKDVFYYPNCIEDSFAPSQLPSKPKDCINVIFYGRIEKEKNLPFIIEVVHILQSKLTNVTLTVIGTGPKDYMDEVMHAANEKLEKNSFSFLPSMKHTELKNQLFDKHFYIFPSEGPREGHSNALTEVMGYGIVPVVSPQGFNRTVVGIDELVIEELNPELYADEIFSIINQNIYDLMSEKVYRRIRDNYTESVVLNNFLKEYRCVFS